MQQLIVCWRISVFIWVSDILLLDYNSKQKHDKNRSKFPKLSQVMMPEFRLPVATPHTLLVPRLQVENVTTLASRLLVFLDKNREVVLIFPWSEGLNQFTFTEIWHTRLKMVVLEKETHLNNLEHAVLKQKMVSMF